MVKTKFTIEIVTNNYVDGMDVFDKIKEVLDEDEVVHLEKDFHQTEVTAK